jgi:hypothetical protein
VAGISANATNISQTIRANRIYDLAATAPSAPTTVAGIYLESTTASGTQVVERNFIHSLTMSTTSTSGGIYGIVLNSGTSSVRNNKIRLGINAAGSAITAAYNITGILEQPGSLASLLYNTVYIGGSGTTTGNDSSFAIRSFVTSGTRDVRNNIFANYRLNSSGTGKHFRNNY